MPTDYWREKVVLITGGTSGLGLAIARGFAAAGAHLALVGLEEEGVWQAVEEFATSGTEVLGLHADITNQEQVDSLITQTIDRFGHLDVLVNNAGRSMRGKVLETTPEQFQSLFDLNALATIRCTKAAVPHLLKQQGHVVNIGSLAAKSASRWTGAYPVSKHAVAAFSQQLRLELGEEGLHVLLVCPGPIKRDDPRLYPLEGLEDIPERARQPGAGVKVRGIPVERLVAKILQSCEQHRAELVMPWKARLLFAAAQLSPRLGDWLVKKNT